MEIIRLENIVKIYRMGNTTVPAVNGVSLSLIQGDFVAIAGPSGSGKTTILNIIGLIDRPTEGRVTIASRDTLSMKSGELTRMRRRVVGFIFQSFNLISGLNVIENVELPLLIGRSNMKKKERKAWVNYLLDEVGLSERKKHRPRELSGGQQQRVAIARALAAKPSIVIADEPTANLDSVTGRNILSLMKKINQEQKTTFVFSTHDEVIHRMADHVVSLKDGKVEKEIKREGGAEA